jgi:GT2 family glycosyltransferase
MPEPKRISVVIPLYNKEREVGRTLRSVFAQRRPADEIVVVNDGSTDGSRDVVARLQHPAVVILDQPNRGVNAARNTGIRAASNPVVALLDADDEWTPAHLANTASLIGKYPSCSVYCTSYQIDKGARGRRRVGIKCSGLDRAIPCAYDAPYIFSSSSIAFTKKVFEQAGGFREGVSFGEDLDLWLRLAFFTPVAYAAEPTAIWHWTATNRNTNAWGNSVEAHHRMFDSLLDSLASLEAAKPGSPLLARARARAASQMLSAIILLGLRAPAIALPLLQRHAREFGPSLRGSAYRTLFALCPSVLNTTLAAGSRVKDYVLNERPQCT